VQPRKYHWMQIANGADAVRRVRDVELDAITVT
jgi:hypothetical protein